MFLFEHNQKEIEVLLNEIFLPILEMRNATSRQKSVLLAMMYRLSQDPQALVEIYLNYDCDSEATENIYERYASSSCKLHLTCVNIDPSFGQTHEHHIKNGHIAFQPTRQDT